MKIPIDNGHGVDTPGKRSPDWKLREYAWNRLIAGRIVAALTDLGHDSQLLVQEQQDVSLSNAAGPSNPLQWYSIKFSQPNKTRLLHWPLIFREQFFHLLYQIIYIGTLGSLCE